MKKKFYLLLAVYLLFALLDGLLTILYSENLKYEANPLVTELALGWGALFTANVCAFAGLYFLTRYTFLKYETIKAPVKNRREYLSQIFFNRPDKFIWSFYRMPKNWKPFIAMSGYAAIYALIAGRIIIVFQWLTFRCPIESYNRLRASMPFARLNVVVAVIVTVACMVIWFENEYKRSKAEEPHRG